MIPLTKKDKLLMVVAVIVLILLVVLSVYFISNIERAKGQGDIFVLDIIDGDTFKMSDETTITDKSI